MKSPFSTFVFTHKDVRQHRKRGILLQYLQQLSESNPDIEVHYVKRNCTTQVVNIKELISNWKEIIK